MSPSGAEVLRQIKSQIDEVDPAAVREQIATGVVIVDVRETEEWSRRPPPRRAARPHGYLESRIEGVAPDRASAGDPLLRLGQPLRLGGADAAPRTSATSTSSSMTGGITLWKDRGYEVEVPRTLSAEQRERYSRHLLLPEVGDRGPAEAAGRARAAARRRRARLADRALPRGRRRRHARDRRRRRRRPLEPAAPGDPHHRSRRHPEGRLGRGDDRRAQPRRRTSSSTSTRLDRRRTSWRSSRDYDIVVDGLDNFPTRYLLNDASVRLQIPVVSGRRSSASTASCRSSSPTRARATAACSPCRRRPSWRRPAAPTACSACCPGRWACCRRPRSSS